MNFNNYYNSQPQRHYQSPTQKSWSQQWSAAPTSTQTPYAGDSYQYALYHASKVNYNDRNFSNYNNRFNPRQGKRYPKSAQQSNWSARNQGRKRSRTDQAKTKDMPIVNVAKKKKKPLSQNISKKGWNEVDAGMALTIEKEYNSIMKKHSLVIKFPDPELNKDIVKDFHPAIENVHFQQASTPRFCFVTLNPTADIDLVMNALNKQKFGTGYLMAELKKDKDDEPEVTPKDIDPYTLYVGNLSNEVTKQAVRNKYPKTVRIDIGYAQKMKYTRYAFVRFSSVNDAIDAFKNTHNSDLYSRSLIVRFRRLHGNTGVVNADNARLQNALPRTAKPDEPPIEPSAKENVPAVDLNCVKDEPLSEESDNDNWSLEQADGFINPDDIKPEDGFKEEKYSNFSSDDSDADLDDSGTKTKHRHGETIDPIKKEVFDDFADDKDKLDYSSDSEHSCSSIPDIAGCKSDDLNLVLKKLKERPSYPDVGF